MVGIIKIQIIYFWIWRELRGQHKNIWMVEHAERAALPGISYTFTT